VVALFALGFGAVAAFARGHPQVCVCVCACACVCVCVCVCVCMRERQYARSVCWALAPCGKYNPVYDRNIDDGSSEFP